MTPEREVLDPLLRQLAALRRSAANDQQLLEPAPADVAEFVAMSPLQESISRALLKCFEQLEDVIARTVRTSLKMLRLTLKGLTPVDIANKAEELDLIADARVWLTLVDLRNELVHEYPDDNAIRFARLQRVIAGLPFLVDASERLSIFAAQRFPESP